MIFDHIKYSSQYNSVHRNFEAVFEYLKNIPADARTGSFVPEPDNVWGGISVYAETNTGKKMYEAHRNFMDIHYVLSGEATFGYCTVDRLKTTQAYDEKADYELLEGDIHAISMKPGDFCIVFPQDAHIPVVEKVGEEDLVRVVVKIRVNSI